MALPTIEVMSWSIQAFVLAAKKRERKNAALCHLLNMGLKLV
jgi:hypothetical protein